MLQYLRYDDVDGGASFSPSFSASFTDEEESTPEKAAVRRTATPEKAAVGRTATPEKAAVGRTATPEKSAACSEEVSSDHDECRPSPRAVDTRVNFRSNCRPRVDTRLDWMLGPMVYLSCAPPKKRKRRFTLLTKKKAEPNHDGGNIELSGIRVDAANCAR